MAEALGGASKTQYDAFIAYASNPDRKLVRQTEAFLEKLHDLGGIKSRKLRICVDGSDFDLSREVRPIPGETPVHAVLRAHLEQCKVLVVFCSRGAVASSSVTFEIEWFLENRPTSAVIPVVTEGIDPGEDPAKVFPAPLIAHGIHKKIWVDFRGAERRRRRRASKVGDYGEARIQLAAAVMNDGTTVDDLAPGWQRIQAADARQRALLAILVAVTMTVLAGVALLLYVRAERARRGELAQRVAAEAARIDATHRLRALLMEQGRELVVKGDPTAALFIAEAGRLEPHDSEGNFLMGRAMGLVERRRVAMQGHDGSVSELAVCSSDWVASGGEDGRVRRWNIESGVEIGPASQVDRVAQLATSLDCLHLAIGGFDGEVLNVDLVTGGTKRYEVGGIARGIALDRSGTTLLVGDYTGTAHRFDLQHGLQSGLADGNSPAWLVALAPDGSSAAIGHADGRVVAWDRDGQHRDLLKVERSANIVRFAPNGSSVTIGGDGGNLVNADLATRRAHRWKGHELSLLAGAWSSNGSRFVASDSSSRVTLRNGDGKQIAVISGHEDIVPWLAFSRDGETLFTADRSGRVGIWSARDGAPSALIDTGLVAVKAATFDPAGKWFALGSADGDVIVWDTAASTRGHSYADGGEWISGVVPAREGVVFSSQEGLFQITKPGVLERLDDAASDGVYSQGAAWAARGRGRVARANCGASTMSIPVLGEVKEIALASNGHSLALLYELDNGWGIDVRACEIGAPLLARWHSPHVLNGLSFDRDSLLFGDDNGVIYVWPRDHYERGNAPARSAARLSGLPYAIRSVPQAGAVIGCPLAGPCRLWHGIDAAAYGFVQDFESVGGYVKGLKVSPNGENVAIVGDAGVLVWRLESGGPKLISRLTHAGNVTAVCFHPKRPMLATAGSGGLVRIWSIDGRLLDQHVVDRSAVLAQLAFDTTGNLLYVGPDSHGRLWELDLADEHRNRKELGEILRTHLVEHFSDGRLRRHR